MSVHRLLEALAKFVPDPDQVFYTNTPEGRFGIMVRGLMYGISTNRFPSSLYVYLGECMEMNKLRQAVKELADKWPGDNYLAGAMAVATKFARELNDG